MANSSATQRTEICRSRITIHSTASMFSLVVMVNGRLIRGASSKPRSGSLNSATNLATAWYDAAVLVIVIQLLANFGSIQPFPGGKLYDCSMLNIQRFSKMKTHGLQNVVFSYERNEPIGPKLLCLNKNLPSIKMTEAKCFRDVFRDQLHELSGQLSSSITK